MGVNLHNIEPMTATSKIHHSLIKTMHPPSPYTRGGQILTSVRRRPDWIQQYPRSIKQLEEMFFNQIVVIFFPMAIDLQYHFKNDKMSMSACDL